MQGPRWGNRPGLTERSEGGSGLLYPHWVALFWVRARARTRATPSW